MGDVFNAMNRARRERGQQDDASPQDAQPPEAAANEPAIDAEISTNDDVSPALPIDHVQEVYDAAPMHKETATRDLAAPPTDDAPPGLGRRLSPPADERATTDRRRRHADR